MTAMSCTGPVDCETWLGLTADSLPVEEALRWAGRPDCGALVLFSGNARDHSEGRSGVTGLAYEAYEEQALPRLERVADEVREIAPEARIAVATSDTLNSPARAAEFVAMAEGGAIDVIVGTQLVTKGFHRFWRPRCRSRRRNRRKGW